MVNLKIYYTYLKIYLIDGPKTQKWVRYQCILRVENRAQYRNHQMKNAVKNEIYPKTLEYMSLDLLFHMIVRNNSLTIVKRLV